MLKELSKEVIMDTEPLLLLLIGLYDKNELRKFKRVKKYGIEDFNLLCKFLINRRIVITPEVLAEISNFAKQLKEDKFSEFLMSNIENLRRIKEIYIGKDDILNAKEVFKFGFTDTSLILLAKETNGEVLTNDYPLFSKCKNNGIKTVFLKELLFQKEIFKW